jgi:antitoxin ParD1/3/4
MHTATDFASWQKMPYVIESSQEEYPMTTMNISVPDEMKAFVEAEMAQEGYASASEYLRALIRDAQKRRARQELEAKLLEGLQGPVVQMTRDDWDSIEREAMEGLAGETIHP